jgi:heme exporter protein CcmD
MTEALHMGGYAAYVWSCYGLSALGLISMAWAGSHRFREERRNVQRRAQTGAAE